MSALKATVSSESNALPLGHPATLFPLSRLGDSSMDQTELTQGFMGSVREAFPDASLIGKPVQTKFERRQTDAFRPHSAGCRFEVDYAVALHG